MVSIGGRQTPVPPASTDIARARRGLTAITMLGLADWPAAELH